MKIELVARNERLLKHYLLQEYNPSTFLKKAFSNKIILFTIIKKKKKINFFIFI